LNGVPTIIASSTTVDAAMAGDFMNLLAAQLIGHQDDPAFNIGLAVYEAVQELKETHGEYALVYGIYGNGNLRACFPRWAGARSRKAIPILPASDALPRVDSARCAH